MSVDTLTPSKQYPIEKQGELYNAEGRQKVSNLVIDDGSNTSSAELALYSKKGLRYWLVIWDDTLNRWSIFYKYQNIPPMFIQYVEYLTLLKGHCFISYVNGKWKYFNNYQILEQDGQTIIKAKTPKSLLLKEGINGVFWYHNYRAYPLHIYSYHLMNIIQQVYYAIENGTALMLRPLIVKVNSANEDNINSIMNDLNSQMQKLKEGNLFMVLNDGKFGLGTAKQYDYTPQALDAIWTSLKEALIQLYRYLGIETNEMNAKKQRVITGELQMISSSYSNQQQAGYDIRKQQIDKLNSLYGTNIIIEEPENAMDNIGNNQEENNTEEK